MYSDLYITLYFTLQRPPVEWTSYPPKTACYVFPYVVSWSQVTGKIHVFNLLDQKCVQEIPFQVGSLKVCTVVNLQFI